MIVKHMRTQTNRKTFKTRTDIYTSAHVHVSSSKRARKKALTFGHGMSNVVGKNSRHVNMTSYSNQALTLFGVGFKLRAILLV